MQHTTASKLIDICEELRNALAAAMRVIYDGGLSAVFLREIDHTGIGDGVGTRAGEIIAQAKGETK